MMIIFQKLASRIYYQLNFNYYIPD